MSEEPILTFEDIVSDIHGPLFAYLTRMTGSTADADDLLQESLLRIAQGLSKLENRSNLKTWAFRIATNIAIDFFRKNKKAELSEIDEASLPSNIDEEDDLILVEMNQCIRGVVDSLPVDYRAPLVLFMLEGKSVSDVAEVCNISVSAAKVRIHRAKARLREVLNDACDFYQNEKGVLRCDPKSSSNE